MKIWKEVIASKSFSLHFVLACVKVNLFQDDALSITISLEQVIIYNMRNIFVL